MKDTSTRARLALTGAVAVAQFARDEWIDDPEAVAAGYHVTTFDDSAVGDSPGNPPYMAGPGAWEPSFEPGDAWRALGAGNPMTVDYRPDGHGKDSISVLIDTQDERGEPLTVAIGLNKELGLYADRTTIAALGGTPPPERDGYDVETMLPRNAGNLREHGVEGEERDRVWDALNGVARTHPAAAIWHEWNDGGRDLPGHADVDRRRSLERNAVAPAPHAAPPAAGRNERASAPPRERSAAATR